MNDGDYVWRFVILCLLFAIVYYLGYISGVDAMSRAVIYAVDTGRRDTPQPQGDNAAPKTDVGENSEPSAQ